MRWIQLGERTEWEGNAQDGDWLFVVHGKAGCSWEGSRQPPSSVLVESSAGLSVSSSAWFSAGLLSELLWACFCFWLLQFGFVCFGTVLRYTRGSAHPILMESHGCP